MARKTKQESSNTYGLEDNEIIIGVKKIPQEKKDKDTISNKKVQSKKKKKNKNKDKQKTIAIIKYSALSIILLVAILCTMFSPLFNVEEINVNGNSKISTNEIISLSQIETGKNTYQISKNKTIKNIKENAYIESVQIKRKLPDKIEITVKERETAFILEFGNGFVYLNNQGYILEVSGESLDVPIIQGQATKDSDYKAGNRLINEDLEKLSMVLRIMEQAQINEIDNLITRIDIENKQNYKIIFETEGKTAYLGNCTNLSTRMLSVKAILEREKGIEGEIFVDMDLNIGYPTFRQRV